MNFIAIFFSLIDQGSAQNDADSDSDPDPDSDYD